MSRKAEAFEHWIRTSFVQMNTELANLYFANKDRAQMIGCGDPIKALLRDEGHTTSSQCLPRATPERVDSAYGVSAAWVSTSAHCDGNELTNPAREERSPFPRRHRLRCTSAHLWAWRRDSLPGTLATHNKARWHSEEFHIARR